MDSCILMNEVLSQSELQRYARHLAMPEFGLEAQRKLKQASVLCIGAGGLGSPVTLYLAAAGVGRIALVDADVVERSNLQRQVLFGEDDLGQPKVEAAARRLRQINPHLNLEVHQQRFTAGNAMKLAEPHDVIVDGTDNFPTRYLSNDVAVWQRKPNVYASVLRFEGQVSVFAPHLGAPCYRCMAPHPPAPGLVPDCAQGGVLGVLPGLIGSMQALETIKLITGLGQPLLGKLLHWDTLSMRQRIIELRRDPHCPVCGDHPSITSPMDIAHTCNASPAPRTPAISVRELALRLQSANPPFLLDVREPIEFEMARIPGSVLIPLGELQQHLDKIPTDRPIAVHCKMGGRSARAVAMLQAQGIEDVVNVEGGITAWSLEVDPSVPLT